MFNVKFSYKVSVIEAHYVADGEFVDADGNYVQAWDGGTDEFDRDYSTFKELQRDLWSDIVADMGEHVPAQIVSEVELAEYASCNAVIFQASNYSIGKPRFVAVTCFVDDDVYSTLKDVER